MSDLAVQIQCQTQQQVQWITVGVEQTAAAREVSAWSRGDDERWRSEVRTQRGGDSFVAWSPPSRVQSTESSLGNQGLSESGTYTRRFSFRSLALRVPVGHGPNLVGPRIPRWRSWITSGLE
jgi:hypothetical protein